MFSVRHYGEKKNVRRGKQLPEMMGAYLYKLCASAASLAHCTFLSPGRCFPSLQLDVPQRHEEQLVCDTRRRRGEKKQVRHCFGHLE